MTCGLGALEGASALETAVTLIGGPFLADALMLRPQTLGFPWAVAFGTNMRHRLGSLQHSHCGFPA